MAYSRSQNQSESERKLQNLKSSLYGYTISTDNKNSNPFPKDNLSKLNKSTKISSIEDLLYLRRDLLKILLLGFLGIAVEIIIFLQTENQLFQALLH